MATVLKANNANIGVATGTTVTTANSGGGGNDAFGAINIGAGNTFVVSSSSPLEGALSYVATQAGANLFESYLALASTVTDFSFQMLYTHATPSVHYALLRTLTATTFTGAAVNVFIRSDNKVHVFDATTAVQSAASAGVLTAGTTYVIQFRTNGSTASVYFYPVGSTTATVSMPSVTIGSTSVGSIRVAIGTASALVTLKFDGLQLGTGGLLARSDVSNAAPTATVGPDQYVAVGSAINLTGSDADSDGTIVSRSWTWDTADTSGPAGTTRKWATGPTISGATTQNATATMATAGAYRAKYVVTDDGSLTSTPVYSNIFVYPVSGAPVGVRNAVKGSWTRVGGSDDTAVLNDGSDSTGHLSPADPTGQADTFLMKPHGPGTSPGAVTFTVRGNSTGGAGISRLVEWYKSDGTTLLGLGVTQTAPSSLGDQSFTLGSTGLAALGALLSDRAELVVKLKPTAF